MSYKMLVLAACFAVVSKTYGLDTNVVSQDHRSDSTALAMRMVEDGYIGNLSQKERQDLKAGQNQVKASAVLLDGFYNTRSVAKLIRMKLREEYDSICSGLDEAGIFSFKSLIQRLSEDKGKLMKVADLLGFYIPLEHLESVSKNIGGKKDLLFSIIDKYNLDRDGVMKILSDGDEGLQYLQIAIGILYYNKVLGEGVMDYVI